MAGAAAHQFDEVPVLLGGVGVAADVADQLGIDFAGGVETEGCADLAVLKVAVDGLGHADHGDGRVVGGDVFRQHAGVGVGVVAADDDEGVELMSLHGGESALELLFRFQFRSAASNDVEAAGVAVILDEGRSEIDEFVFDQTGWPAQEAYEIAFRRGGLDAVKNAGNDIVAAGGLAAGQNDADVEGFLRGFLRLGESESRFAVDVREKLLDLRGVGHGLGRLHDRFGFDLQSGFLKEGRQFRLILSAI